MVRLRVPTIVIVGTDDFEKYRKSFCQNQNNYNIYLYNLFLNLYLYNINIYKYINIIIRQRRLKYISGFIVDYYYRISSTIKLLALG